VQCFVLTIVLWAVGAYLELFPAGWQYDHAPGMFAFLNMSALVLCCVLYIKGRYAPSTPDAGHSGNLIFDVRHTATRTATLHAARCNHHCNTLQHSSNLIFDVRHTATPTATLSAARCNNHCSTLQHLGNLILDVRNTLRHAATHTATLGQPLC